MRSVFISLLCFFCLHIAAKENVNFISKPLTAGRASLTENAFIIPYAVGMANFSPELRFPIQIIYNSASESSGIFGYAWNSPQLESSAFFDKDGVLWTTPWGEKIKFFPKKEEKQSKDTIKIELYELAKQGKGFFAPYADWEAVSSDSPKDIHQSGDWVFTGKKKYEGWKFVYRDAKLHSITASSGRSITFKYNKEMQLLSIEQAGTVFVELAYKGRFVSSIVVNGIKTNFTYARSEVIILPKTQDGKVINAKRPRLTSIQTGELNPVDLEYKSGYLHTIRQGDFCEEFVVQTETLTDRKANFLSRNVDNKVKHTGKVAGRLSADNQFKYEYDYAGTGKIKLINKSQQTASYNFAQNTGIFAMTDFSGKKNTIFYFMRYDVAYLGKVRKIVDGRDRDVVSYRYDKLSGDLLRIRDMAENDIDFSYDKDGNLILVSRRAANQKKAEPVTAFKYNKNQDPVSISKLNAEGKEVVTTEIAYNKFGQPTQVSNGQMKNSMTYNEYGYPVAIRNVFNQTQTLKYDEFNRLQSVTDLYGVTTYYKYNSSGKITAIERKDGDILLTSVKVVYNKNGLPISYTDQAGRVKVFERDAFGRVVKEFFPDDTSVEYTYNAAGQLHKVLDQNKHTITFDWNNFGLDAKTTAANQLTDYVHDKYGLLKQVDSKWKDKTDRSIKYEYDDLDRLIKVSYADGQIETFQYDSWGKLISASRGNKTTTFQYDYFGRMIAKNEGVLKNSYTYNPWGQRTSRVTQNGSLILSEIKMYDQYGRLSEIRSGNKVVKYVYNEKNQLAAQIVDGVKISFEYTKYGQLKKKIME